MKYVSTRKGIEATSAETVFQGLAPDGGLYVPVKVGMWKSGKVEGWKSGKVEGWNSGKVEGLTDLGNAERFVMNALFDDLPEAVREDAVARLLSRFPAEDPIPLVEKDGLHILELFHGKTGAFKDVALSMLPVFMRHSANGKRVLILTATSGDTGSAAMQGFAGIDGTEIIVFYPATGTSKIQRLQMTTPADANVHAVGIRGNFDDAQAAVKRIFASAEINAEAAAHGITLSSANSINTGRLIPQIAYYILAGAKLVEEWKSGKVEESENYSTIPPFHHSTSFDVVVPSGNFGNILAAYYAKLLGSPIRKLVVASNVNDVLARFVKTGVYDPGPTFTVTNSPSMDIRISSNVERLLWMLNYQVKVEGEGEAAAIAFACAEVSRMMKDLKEKGRYELNDAAKERLFADFVGGVATPEETEAEMRRMREACGYLLDPHSAVATFVARRWKGGNVESGMVTGCRGERGGDVPLVVAATATPYKFPETCQRAFGGDVLVDPPPSFRELETLPVAQTRICDVDKIDDEVRRLF